MKELVRLGDPYHILRVERLAKADSGRLEPLNVIAVHALHREFDREILERPAHFEHIPETLLRDAGHLRAAARYHRDQTLEFQLAYGLANRRAAHTELLCELNFHQALAGFHLAL